LYFINAHERFGGWLDDSLWRWYQLDRPQDPTGPFSLSYLPMSLYTAFFMAPDFRPVFPWIYPTVAGQSLLTTSPALILALRSRAWGLWLAVALSMAPALTVYAWGYAQVGARYWLLALPFMVLMMGAEPLDRLGRILIVLSILAMDYQMWFWRVWA
jgi:hypothetical protein